MDESKRYGTHAVVRRNDVDLTLFRQHKSSSKDEMKRKPADGCYDKETRLQLPGSYRRFDRSESGHIHSSSSVYSPLNIAKRKEIGSHRDDDDDEHHRRKRKKRCRRDDSTSKLQRCDIRENELNFEGLGRKGICKPRQTPSPDEVDRQVSKKTHRTQRHRHRRIRKLKKKYDSRRRSPSSSSSSDFDDNSKKPTGVVSDDEEIDVRKGESNQRGTAALGCAIRRVKGGTSTESVSSFDNTYGHFRGKKGYVLVDRYRIIREVGLGTFGRVVECLDLKRRSTHHTRNDRYRGQDPYVAIKIVRNIKRYCNSAKIEASIVQQINRREGRGLSHCVIMHDAFSFDGHYCLVFESLGPSLYDFLKRHNYQPFPMVCVQDFAVQLLETLEFLHGMRLIHTDLKLENILLMNDRETYYRGQRVPESTKIKIIDFGGACYDEGKKSSVINTRQYRAPEVILGTGWSMPSDMWSTGCIFSELYLGELLFSTHDNIEHLALIEHVIGYFPFDMVMLGKNCPLREIANIAKTAFDSRGYHRMERILAPDKVSYVRRFPRLEQIVSNPHDGWFLRLLQGILCIDPKLRATARECLNILSRYTK